MPVLVIAPGVKVVGGGGSTGAAIQLSGSHSVLESASIGTAIGVFSVSGGSGTYVFTLSLDPDNKFDINVDGVTLENDDTFDFETKTSHQVTVHADNGAGSILDRTFIIDVTDVAESGETDDDWAAWVAAAA